MDVSRPGKTVANPTSRPIITGHGAMMKDPMVRDEQESSTIAGMSTQDAVKQEPEKLTARSERAIQPLLAPEQTDIAAEAPVAKDAASSTAAEDDASGKAQIDEDMADKKPITDSEDSPESTESTSGTDDSSVSEEAVVDAVIDQAGADKKQKKQAEQEKANEEVLQKLVAEKKYFVPISHGHHAHGRRKLMLVLALVVALVVAFYAAIDARLLRPGFDVPVHLFPQADPASGAVSVPAVTLAPTPTTTPTATATVAAQKSYTDSAKLYTLQYPADWKFELDTAQTTGGVKDYTKVSQPVRFGPNDSRFAVGRTVNLQADTTTTLAATVHKNWTDNKHTPTTETVKGIKIEHVVIDFVSNAESYKDDNYLLTKGNSTVFVTFRQKYHHDYPAENWDQTNIAPAVQTLVKSVTIN